MVPRYFQLPHHEDNHYLQAIQPIGDATAHSMVDFCDLRLDDAIGEGYICSSLSSHHSVGAAVLSQVSKGDKGQACMRSLTELQGSKRRSWTRKSHQNLDCLKSSGPQEDQGGYSRYGYILIGSIDDAEYVLSLIIVNASSMVDDEGVRAVWMRLPRPKDWVGRTCGEERDIRGAPREPSHSDRNTGNEWHDRTGVPRVTAKALA
ncbi:hypothetical protein EDD18DRAFT_1112017 [Armillaria luteobubalina]|uniref:Uncharacterized protein n=1 Tax=Armillaria luteobubalina TaxID=153913 RepID=A0AA39UIL5_9AGAR|nr:hypothetical protein EDD18DRAFT_1112017 [Armillaria luteobubalina]